MRITLNRSGQSLRGVAYTDGVGNLIRVQGQPLGINDPVLRVEPPVIPETSQPPLPPAYRPANYTEARFNHLGLPRLQTFESLGLLTTVDRVILQINGQDYSNNVISFDYNLPISGEAIGQVELTHTTSRVIQDGEINFGDRFTYTLCWGSSCQAISSGYVVSQPRFTYSDTGEVRITIRLGDELELFAQEPLEPKQRYCGEVPKLAGSLASIYAQVNGLYTRAFPQGHTLLEPVQDFLNDTPYEFLQALYEPLDWDVRGREDGSIQVVPRPGFQNPITLKIFNTLETPEASRFSPFSVVPVQNEFEVDSGMLRNTARSERVTGLETDTRPWFQNGFTRTTTDTTSVGDTAIFSREVTWGYVPTASTLTQAQLSTDPCESSPIETEWGVVKDVTTQLQYSVHESGAYLVHGRKVWTYGRALEDIPQSTSKTVYEGILAYEEESYLNTAQISQACRKDWIHLQTYKRVRRFARDTGVYRLISDLIEEYSGQRLGQGAVSTRATWLKTVASGEWSQGVGWVKQPVQSFQADPPQSVWIRPVIERVTAQTEARWGNFPERRAETLDCPACFTESQLKSYGERWLREQAGLSGAVLCQVPMNLMLSLGDSVIVRGIPYQVWGIEYNQTLEEVTKTLQLLRVY